MKTHAARKRDLWPAFTVCKPNKLTDRMKVTRNRRKVNCNKCVEIIHNSCAHCGGWVPPGFRRNAYNNRAKKGAKTFYHYACTAWRKI